MFAHRSNKKLKGSLMSKISNMATILARSRALHRRPEAQPSTPDPQAGLPPEVTRPLDSWAPRRKPKAVTETTPVQPVHVPPPPDLGTRASKFGPSYKQRYSILGISVSQEEKKALTTYTKTHGHKSLSEWARQALFGAAGLPLPARRAPAYEKGPKKKKKS